MHKANSFELSDGYISSKVLRPQDGEHMRLAKIISHVKDDMVNVIGVSISNPILDTSECCYVPIWIHAAVGS